MDSPPVLLNAATNLHHPSRPIRHVLLGIPEQFRTRRGGDVVDSKFAAGVYLLLLYVCYHHNLSSASHFYMTTTAFD